MTQNAFDKLMAFLDADRELAGRKYEEIRRKLITFFECRGCANAEDETDTTINIVARKLVEGQEITGDEPSRYIYGIARNVLREYWGRLGRRLNSLESLPPTKHPYENPVETLERQQTQLITEQQLDALAQCLLLLSQEARDLLNQYYSNIEKVSKKSRRTLAKQLGISLNTLRIRAYRARVKLREHLHEYMETHPATEINIGS